MKQTITNVVNDGTAVSRESFRDVESHEDFEPEVIPTCVDFKVAVSDAELAFAAKLYSDPLMNRTQVQKVIEYTSEFLTSGFLNI